MRLAIAVLTADNPSDAYGAATHQGVAARLLRGLAGGSTGAASDARRARPRRGAALADMAPSSTNEDAASSMTHARHGVA